jgi:murein tripeptide amidase MpaA
MSSCGRVGWSKLLLIIGLAWPLTAGADEFETVAERTDYRLTSTYEETADYLQRLDDASDWVKLTQFGVTPQGRTMHLLVVSKDGAFTPEAARQTGKVIALVQNGIHAGEIDGKDACLALIRDMVITREKEHLLDNVILLMIPMFNLDGHENRMRYTRPNQDGPENAGFRATAQFLNLNRDYLKADAPEMRAWLANWVAWMPDFFVDDHVTDGADWQYTVSYSAPWHPNSAAPIREWIKTYYDPFIVDHVEEAGYKIFPYAFQRGGDFLKGVATFVSSPRLSDGYTVLWNRAGILVEMHSLKDYRSRVLGNCAMLEGTLAVLNRNAAQLKAAIAEADAETEAGLTDWYPLTFRYDGDSVMVDLQGYAYDTVLSEASGTFYIKYHRDRPQTFHIPYFKTFAARDSILPPRAYLIPREWNDQIERLHLHGVRIDTLIAPLTTQVEQYYVDSVKWDGSSYEGHVRPSFRATVRETTITCPAGTAVVDLRQRAAKVAIHALEPKGPDSFIAWGMWNTVFERKEYIEDYMIDPIGDSMLANDPKVRTEFLRKLRTDSKFSGDPDARRMFFYEHTKYAETTYGLYPVARLMGQLPPVAPWKE